jgi:quercetin dioxygenase-like cupin family protein
MDSVFGRRISGLILVPVLALVGAAVVRAEDPVVPVHREPHHRQVFQSGSTRILDLQIPPGDMSWFHRHDWPVLYVTLGVSRTRNQNLGEDWGAVGAARGGNSSNPNSAAPSSRPPTPPPGPLAIARVSSTTSYAERPVTHRIQNIGDGLFRAIVVINETGGDDGMSEQAAGFGGRPELTNRWFRAYRFALAPGESTPSHRHETPVVIVQSSDGRGVGVGPMTFEFNERGQWAFFDARVAHEIRNTGDERVELVEVEVRQPTRRAGR